MELYRVLSTPPRQSDCFCDQYIRELYKRACPELPRRFEDLDLERLAEDEAKIFFPRKAVCDFIMKTPGLLDDITKCHCDRCRPFMPNSGQRKDLLKQFRDSPEKASLIVANLIYLRETRMLYEISRAIDFTEQVVGEVELKEYPVFRKNFSRTKSLFKPPILRLGHTESRFEPGTRFPFVNEEICGGGSFGVVTRFEIHEDYIDEEVEKLVHRYMSRPEEVVPSGTKLFFARKTIRGARNQNLMEEVQLERDVLGVIRDQKEEDKKHLIDLIAFYTFGDEINLVFPYLEGNLEKVLYSDWIPNVNLNEEFPNNWISRGILGLADGLKIIHDPPTQPQLSDKGRIIGFHFDLKPANILVTADGTFKITDFGQALIKLVKVGEGSSGGVPHLGGDPRYAPPEEMPTREQVKRSSQSYLYLNEDRSVLGGSRLDVGRANTNAEAASAPRLMVPASNHSRRSSMHSITRPQEPLGSAKYDIWSLACVMLETLTHTCLGGKETVEAFQADRLRYGPQGAFHTCQGRESELHICVQDQLHALETGHNSTSSWTSPMQAYMQDLVKLMRKMLSIREEDRPDALGVAEDLEWALKKFKIAETDEDGLVNTMRERTSHMSRSGFNELAHDEMGTSFLDVEDIYVQDFESGSSVSRCRIRVYASRPGRGDGGNAEIIIFIASKRNGVVEVEPYSCPMSKTTRYSPLYLNTATERSWADSCRLMTDKFDKRLLFRSKPAELLSFQAVLFQHVVEPGKVTADSSLTELAWNLYRSISPPVKVQLTLDDYKEIDLKTLAVQIWTTKPHTSALRFPSQATTPSTTSSGQNASRTRLVLFLDPQRNEKTGKRYQMLQIPLEPRLGSIKEGGSSSDGTDTTATSLHFVPTDSHATNGGFTVILSEVRENFPKAPILSLDPEIYRREIDPPKERRSRGIRMLFHHTSAKEAIEAIRRHFNTANESNQPQIMWRERRASNRRQRRSVD